MTRRIAPLSWTRLSTLLLVLPLLAFITRPSAAQMLSPADKALWAGRMASLIPNSGEGYRMVQDLLLLPSEASYEVVRDNWTSLPNADAKQYILANLSQSDHPHSLEILNLGATDPSVPVQNRALQLLEGFGFQTFVEDYSAYVKWRKQTTGKSAEDVITSGMRDAVSRLAAGDDAERISLMNLMVRTNISPYTKYSRIRRQAAIDAGLPEAMLKFVNSPNLTWMVFQVLRNLKPGEAFLRKSILPLTDRKIDPSVRYQALNTLAGPENGWAQDIIMKMLLDEYPDASSDMLGSVLAQIGDPRSLPILIAMLDTDNTPEGVRTIGNILTQLTGVNNGQAHDAAWWHAWWVKNSERFAPDVRALPFPKLALRVRPAPQPLGNGNPAELAPRKPELHQIANDPKRAYWLIGPPGTAVIPRIFTLNGAGLRADMVRGGDLAARSERIMIVHSPDVPPGPPKPAAGAGNPGLLVVMTSDGDGAGAAAFWADVAHKALADKYYVAVVVAPKWTLDQKDIWITRMKIKNAKDPKDVKDVKFPVEALAADVVKDVAASHAIDPAHVFLHGAGEGGLAAYSASLEETTPFRGFYILASGFKSQQLPPLTHAKGRRYYIQNTQDDRLAPFWMASAAQKLLTEQGATAKLDTRPGYFGGKQDQAMWDQLKAVVTWLENTK